MQGSCQRILKKGEQDGNTAAPGRNNIAMFSNRKLGQEGYSKYFAGIFARHIPYHDLILS